MKDSLALSVLGARFGKMMTIQMRINNGACSQWRISSNSSKLYEGKEIDLRWVLIPNSIHDMNSQVSTIPSGKEYNVHGPWKITVHICFHSIHCIMLDHF